jgi:hypothetical protein|tara:strand:+ start:410 stop:652 length:243 start_codon:yes stop_codon:yes gene_type:complete
MNQKINPTNYQIDCQLAEVIWKSLFESGNKELAKILSKTMIEQGCQAVELDDASLILMFWKDYLENEGMISFSLEKKIFH